MLNNEQLQAFALEISTFGNIPISSKRCGIGCIYCKVHMDPVLRRFPSIPEITMDDLNLGFRYVDNTRKYLRLGAGVLVAANTDPYLHPKIYDFIKHTSNSFPDKKITTVTTGSYVKEARVDFLNNISNFGIDLSLVTMQEERESIVPKATRVRIKYLLKHAPLNKITLMFTGNLDVLKRDLDLVYSRHNNRGTEILVRRIEYTKYSQNRLNSLAKRSIDGYEECINFLNGNFPSVIYTVPVLKEIYKGGNNEYFDQAEERLIALKKRFVKDRNNHFEVICSDSGFPYFNKALSGFKNVKVHLVKNYLYGGSVTVSGLLNQPDIIAQFKPQFNNSIIVLPKEMYNKDSCDIMGNGINELKRSLKSELWIA